MPGKAERGYQMQIETTQNTATASQYTQADDAFAHADTINDNSEFYAILHFVRDATGEYFVVRVYDCGCRRYLGLAR